MNFRSRVTTVCAALLVVVGCATQSKQNQHFFTSGSHQADQRADQRIAKDQQIKGKGSGGSDTSASAAKSDASRSLFERLGGESGLRQIVNDFIPRVLDDPRVNFQRRNVVYGGFSFHHNRSMYWDASPDHVHVLEEHMLQFFALATGGPSNYQGKTMGEAHGNLHISNAEFDAAVGDLKASLDKLTVAVAEQKELLAIVESTRAEVVEER